MEDLLSQFSSLGDQALKGKNFDPSRVEHLMELFEVEAERSWSAAEVEFQKAAGEADAELRAAERSLNALLGAATDDYRRTDGASRRAHRGGLSSLVMVTKAMKKKAPVPATATTKPARDGTVMFK